MRGTGRGRKIVSRETTIVPTDLIIQFYGRFEACPPLLRYIAVVPRDHVEVVSWITAVSLPGHDTGDSAEVYQGIGLIFEEPSDTAPHVPLSSRATSVARVCVVVHGARRVT